MRAPTRDGWLTAAAAAAAGLLVALSLPPWGWWPLAFAGLALWEALLARQPRARRWRRTWLFSVCWLGPGMAWMWFLTMPGYLVAVAIFGALHATVVLAMPQRVDPDAPVFARGDDPWRWLALPCALTAAEALRFAFPFGGVPLATLAISQVAGPLGGLARIGGALLITFVAAFVGTNLRRVVRFLGSRQLPAIRDAWPWVAALAVVPALLILAAVAPDGTPTGELDVTFVQGGGEQGTRAIDTDPREVVERHLAATRGFDSQTDLVVWPENVIDVAEFATSVEREEIAAEALRLGAPFAVGITEDTADREHFLNAQVLVQPDGAISSRYEKEKRVPFGEYMPLRGLLSALGAPTDAVPRDAVAGSGPAVLESEWGNLGVMISWEVFFGSRARDGLANDAVLLLNPTNGSSYTGTILQSQQVASSRLRALETGRWVVQVSPTGFSAFVGPDGTVYDRTAQREAAVRSRAVELRTGKTWYTTLGDGPFLAVVLALWALPVIVPFVRRVAGRLRRPAAA